MIILRQMNKIKRLLSASLAIVLVAVAVAIPAHRSQAATTVAITSPTSASTVNGTSFTVSGTASPGVKVTVKVNSAAVGSTYADTSGNWSLAVTNQAAGAKTIEATATGNAIAYVNNRNSETISMINTSTNTVTDTFAVGGDADSGTTLNADGTRLAIFPGAGGDDTVKIFNTATQTLVDTFSANDSFGGQFTPDGTKLYVTESAGSAVSVWETTNYTQIGSDIAVGAIPTGIAMNPDGSEVYISNTGVGSISIINTTSDTVTGDLVTGLTSPAYSVISSDGDFLYVVSGALASVYKININTQAVVSNIASGTSVGLAINPANTTLYGTSASNDEVAVINAVNSTSTSSTIGNEPVGIIVSNDGTRVYVNSAQDDTTLVLDASTMTQIAGSPITVGDSPGWIVMGPDETATASVSFTLTNSTLADTGLNSRAITAAALFMTLLGGAIVVRRLKFSR